jgi:hypothetical protein
MAAVMLGLEAEPMWRTCTGGIYAAFCISTPDIRRFVGRLSAHAQRLLSADWLRFATN